MRTYFQTVNKQGLQHHLPPMILWQKAKKYGIWNPKDLDFSKDVEDWQQFTPIEKEVILNLTTLFIAGEESVTLDLLPLIMVIAKQNRLEEELFLTSFLWEEAKHVEAFQRFLDEVVGKDKGDLSRFYTPSYQKIFFEELPNAMNALINDDSATAIARASTTYNMIVEGVLAETGYHAYYEALLKANKMPGMLSLIAKLKQDESRHIAYGVYLLSRLVAEHGDIVWNAIENRMNELIEPAMGIIIEALGKYENLPFDIELNHFIEYATKQFQKRTIRIEKARYQTLNEVNHVAINEELL